MSFRHPEGKRNPWNGTFSNEVIGIAKIWLEDFPATVPMVAAQ
jgi:hypothetical protein